MTEEKKTQQSEEPEKKKDDKKDDDKEEKLTPEQIKAKKKQENKDAIEGCGCLILIAIVIILGVVFLIRGCNRDNDNSSSSDAKTEQTSSSSDDDSDNNDADDDSSDSKEDEEKIKDSQKSMADDLVNNSDLTPYIRKIKYQGDGNAQIIVTEQFTELSNTEKTAIAKTVNNLVTSDAEDNSDMSVDNYSMLVFIKQNLIKVGSSKISDHNEYKWK